MSAVVNAILPVFALILAGYIGRRSGCLGKTAASELNRAVVWLFLPALLFTTTATAKLEEIWHPGFIIVVVLSTLLVFAATVIYRMRAGQRLADASVDGLCTSYANTGYVGIPLCILVLGDAGIQPAIIATLNVVFVLFAIAVVCIEIDLQTEQTLGKAVIKVLRSLAMNPLIVSPIVGAAWAVSGLPIPAPALQFLDMLGTATIPCALASLGAFLAHKHSGSTQGATGLVLIKLIVHPLIAWVLAFHVFHLPPFWANAALLLSALPTGTGPYMLAELYGREGSVSSQVTLVSTLGSLVTLSICLYLIG